MGTETSETIIMKDFPKLTLDTNYRSSKFIEQQAGYLQKEDQEKYTQTNYFQTTKDQQEEKNLEKCQRRNNTLHVGKYIRIPKSRQTTRTWSEAKY